MDQNVLKYLDSHNIAVLTTLLPDGSPHSASLHYSHNSNPFEIYFSTERTSRKCKGLLNGEVVKASLVVGFSEEEWITVQMDGEVTTVTGKDELVSLHKVHYAKHPGSEEYKENPDSVFLKFTPYWWRYTDYNTKPVTTISSE